MEQLLSANAVAGFQSFEFHRHSLPGVPLQLSSGMKLLKQLV